MRSVYVLLLITNALTGFGKARPHPTSGNKPNILWITCEDMSPNLPAFGDTTVATPNLDKLAAEGIKYTHLFSVSGVCAPSRSALITGMYPTYMGTNHMRTKTNYIDKKYNIPSYEAVPPAEVKCFPEYMRAAGYYCTNNAKTDYQFGDPFTAWDENGKKAHWRNRPAGQPFFSVFNITRTHESQIWVHQNKPLRVDPTKVPLPPYYPESPVIRRDIARYYDNIMVMDSTVGVILQQLKADGLLENTVVLFFSDHGAGLPWYKRELYDRGLRAPLIVRFPNKQGAGTTNRELHSFVDLAPTVLSLASVSVPKHLQGQAFLGHQQAKENRTYIFAARDRMDEHYDLVRAVRDKRFKYIRNYQPAKTNYQDITYRRQMNAMQEILKMRDEGQLNTLQRRWFETKPTEELYDTQADPYELKNLAADPAYKNDLERLRQQESNWVRQTLDQGFMPETEMVNLMWPDNVQPITGKPTITPVNKVGKTRAVQFACATPGASIGYKIGEGQWQLWNGQPITLSKGTLVVVKAIRYGYKASEENIFKL